MEKQKFYFKRPFTDSVREFYGTRDEFNAYLKTLTKTAAGMTRRAMEVSEPATARPRRKRQPANKIYIGEMANLMESLEWGC